jgi:5'-phosphate synthase pdxT subunit
MDIAVTRNAYGRQVDSFEADLEIPVLGPPPLRAVFIRAPVIEEAGSEVEVLATFDERPVLARQGTLLVSSFHPELAPDDRIHLYFLEMIRSCK